MFDPASLTLPETWNETSMPLDFLEDFANDKSCHCRGWDEATLRESLAQTYGMIAHIDDCVGQILAKLEGKGLAENTVIAFISDHGDYLGSHGLLFKGYFPFEGDRRVPFIWNAPDGVSQGLRKEVVSNLDFVPTILDFAGIDQTKYLEDINRNRENPVKLIGRSLREAIEKGKELAPSPALIEHYEYRAGPALAQLSHRILVEENFKICFYDELNKGVLYDLEKDPEERINLWDNPEYQLIKSEMLQRLESLRKEEINIRITKFNRTFN
jgi:arylsulfatase A-like enzyme